MIKRNCSETAIPLPQKLRPCHVLIPPRCPCQPRFRTAAGRGTAALCCAPCHPVIRRPGLTGATSKTSSPANSILMFFSCSSSCFCTQGVNISVSGIPLSKKNFVQKRSVQNTMSYNHNLSFCQENPVHVNSMFSRHVIGM